MKYLIKYKQKLVEHLFGQLRTSFVNFGKTFVSTSFMSSTAACHSELVEESVQAGLRRFNALNYKIIAVLSILTIPFLNSCTTVKEYEKNKLNDAEMVLGNRTVELKHGNRWQLVLGARPAGMAIRALSWLGAEQASSALKMLHTKLPPAEWAAMRSARAVLPSWMARAVSEVSEHA